VASPILRHSDPPGYWSPTSHVEACGVAPPSNMVGSVGWYKAISKRMIPNFFILHALHNIINGAILGYAREGSRSRMVLAQGKAYTNCGFSCLIMAQVVVCKCEHLCLPVRRSLMDGRRKTMGHGGRKTRHNEGIIECVCVCASIS
jgi:hypothetical protein